METSRVDGVKESLHNRTPSFAPVRIFEDFYDLGFRVFLRRDLLGTIGSQRPPQLVSQRLLELLLGLRLFGLVFQSFEVRRAVGQRRVVSSLKHGADAPGAIQVVAAAVLVGVPGVRGVRRRRDE